MSSTENVTEYIKICFTYAKSNKLVLTLDRSKVH